MYLTILWMKKGNLSVAEVLKKYFVEYYLHEHNLFRY